MKSRLRGYTVDIFYNFNDHTWDEFLASQYGGILEQTSFWAKAKAVYGWKPIRVVIKRDGKIIAGFQILYREILKIGKIGYISKGPVICKNTNSEILEFIINQIKAQVKQNHIHILIVQPPLCNDSFLSYITTNDFKPTKLVNIIKASILIDLSKNIENIFLQITSSMRKQIRQGLRRGINIRAGLERDIPQFFTLMKDTCDRRKVNPSPPDEKFFKELWNNADFLKKTKLFLAEYKNEIIAGIWIIGFGNTARAWKIGWSGKYGRLRPNQLLYWESIKWAKRQGYRYFDLFGISESAARKLANNLPITRLDVNGADWHKTRFGGMPVFYPPAYEYICSPFVKIALQPFFLKPFQKLKTLRKI